MPQLNTRTIWIGLLALVTLVGGPWYVMANQQPVEVRVTAPTIRSCADSSLVEKARMADVILEGTVEMVVLGEKYAEVYVQPSQVFRGELQRPYRIFATPLNLVMSDLDQSYRQVEIDGQRVNELSFASDHPPYLLFLRKTDGGYVTSRCDGSRLLGDGLTEGEKVALGVVQ